MRLILDDMIEWRNTRWRAFIPYSFIVLEKFEIVQRLFQNGSKMVHKTTKAENYFLND